jgi:membrane-bound lytic murein transglycosylase B
MNGKTPIQLAEAKTNVKLSKWSAAGALAIDGSALPTADLKARLIMPSGASGPTFLDYSNFDSILAWNRSNYYALAIGHLSDTLR